MCRLFQKMRKSVSIGTQHLTPAGICVPRNNETVTIERPKTSSHKERRHFQRRMFSSYLRSFFANTVKRATYTNCWFVGVCDSPHCGLSFSWWPDHGIERSRIVHALLDSPRSVVVDRIFWTFFARSEDPFRHPCGGLPALAVLRKTQAAALPPS